MTTLKHFPRPLFRFVGNQSHEWLTWTLAFPGAVLLQGIFGLFGQLDVFVLVFFTVLFCESLILFLIRQWFVHKLTLRWFAISSFLVAAFGTSFVIELVLSGFQQFQNINIEKIVSGGIFFCWTLALVSSFRNRRTYFKSTRHRLLVSRSQLKHVEETLTNRNLEVKNYLIERIRQQIRLAKEKVSKATPSNFQGIDLGNEIVQPLLVELDKTLVSNKPELSFSPSLGKERRTVAQVINKTVRSTNDTALASAFFVGSTWLVTGLSMGDLLVTLSTPLISASTLFFTLIISGKVLEKKSVWKRNWLGMIIACMFWAVSAIAAGIIPLLIAKLPSYVLIPIGIQTGLVILFFALGNGYQKAGDDLLVQIKNNNAQLNSFITKSNTSLRNVQVKLGRFIHGELQAACLALTRETQNFGSTQSARIEEAVIVLNNIVENLPSRLENIEYKKLEEVISEINAIWAGVTQLKFNIPKKIFDTLKQHGITSNVLAEILVESITNAVKHGNAKWVEVSVSFKDQETLLVQVTNFLSSSNLNVSNYHREKQGLGGRLFDSVCLDWRLSSIKHETKFEASLPLVATER